eukprot:1317961-Pleurochrysis_carterae.AAC.2
MAAACGENLADFGGECWRIGGATDLRDRLGDASRAAIKQRGRWQSIRRGGGVPARVARPPARPLGRHGQRDEHRP